MDSVEFPSASAPLLRRFQFARERLYRHRYQDAFVGVAMALGFATLTGLSAQVAIRTPFSPVPITLQVLAALVSGSVLGYRWGTISQGLYVVLGALLIPWYAPAATHGAFSTGGLSGGSLSGIAQLTGGLGGYIVAFPVAAFLVGFLSDRYVQARGPLPQIGMMGVGVAIIYTLGAIGLWLAFRWPFAVVLEEGVLLFIPVDLAKAVLAGLIGTSLVPKRPFGPEKAPSAPYRPWWPFGGA